MKQLFIYLIPLCLLASSCKKFLEESSPDEIRPTTTDDLYALMISDAYPYTVSMEDFSDMLTDDVRSYGMPRTFLGEINAEYTSYFENGRGIFAFDPLELEGTQGTAATALNAWARCYSRINGCNIIIDYIDRVSGTTEDKNALLGQAFFLRAFYYFKLLQLYCLPYPGNEARPGVPLILSMQVSDVHVPRSTLRETFDQVEKDLQEASTLLHDNYVAPNGYRVGYLAAYALLSRVYLYKSLPEDLDKVIDYAERVLAERPLLTTLSNYVSVNSVFVYDQNVSSEVLWQYGPQISTVISFFPEPLTYSGMHAPYEVSDELSLLYDRGTDEDYQGDLRFRYFFTNMVYSGSTYLTRGTKVSMNSPTGEKGIRVAEMYLNAAEAYARRFSTGGQGTDRTTALQYLNTLRENRFDTRNQAYVPVDATDADSLLSFCLHERRRELSMEETFRWADIKRLGLSVTHNFIDANNNSTIYTLPAHSPLYALPIPATAIERNNNLAQNPR